MFSPKDLLSMLSTQIINCTEVITIILEINNNIYHIILILFVSFVWQKNRIVPTNCDHSCILCLIVPDTMPPNLAVYTVVIIER